MFHSKIKIILHIYSGAIIEITSLDFQVYIMHEFLKWQNSISEKLFQFHSVKLTKPLKISSATELSGLSLLLVLQIDIGLIHKSVYSPLKWRPICYDNEIVEYARHLNMWLSQKWKLARIKHYIQWEIRHSGAILSRERCGLYVGFKWIYARALIMLFINS